jgi:hypothetical protein
LAFEIGDDGFDNFSEKSDVFSLGVMLFDLFSEKKYNRGIFFIFK